MISKILDHLQYGWQLASGQRSKAEQQIGENRERDVLPHLPTRSTSRILDLANGRLRPQYLLLKAAGADVYGVDLANEPRKGGVGVAYALARQIFCWRLRIPARWPGHTTLICADVGRLPFPDATFDLVTSVAAFEHFLDVPRVTAELARVMRAGGVAWIGVHSFTSLSGGHNVRLAQVPLRHLPRGVDPWDHLRKRRLPFSVPLNEWRISQYLDTFASHFDVLKHYCAASEGEDLLTSQVRADLVDYSRGELTCLAYIFVLQRRIQGPGS